MVAIVQGEGRETPQILKDLTLPDSILLPARGRAGELRKAPCSERKCIGPARIQGQNRAIERNPQMRQWAQGKVLITYPQALIFQALLWERFSLTWSIWWTKSNSSSKTFRPESRADWIVSNILPNGLSEKKKKVYHCLLIYSDSTIHWSFIMSEFSQNQVTRHMEKWLFP